MFFCQKHIALHHNNPQFCQKRTNWHALQKKLQFCPTNPPLLHTNAPHAQMANTVAIGGKQILTQVVEQDLGPSRTPVPTICRISNGYGYGAATRYKVFVSLFSKSDRGLGAAPQVAPAGAKHSHGVSFLPSNFAQRSNFFCASGDKEKSG